MELSIICPTYNEIKFIDAVVASLCADDGLKKEVLIVDGGSADGTIERVKSLAKDFPSLRLVNNPGRTSTHAFNTGFGNSTGKYVAFVGAHATYDKDYFKYGVSYLDNNECDAVGGPLKQMGKTSSGKAIALAMSSKIGVGDTEFRTESKKMYVDSVAFAIYRRDMVEKCGLMDITLPVNQDDEFHYRLRQHGYRILMVPEMKAVYYVRDSYRKLFRQYFKYGLYKPAVLRKVKDSVRLRHLIPSFFSLYLLSLPVAFFVHAWLLPLFVYLILIFIRSLTFDADMKTRLLAIPVFPILHTAYGSGFLTGLIRRK